MPPASKPKNEAQRIASLKKYQILDTQRDERFDSIVNLARRLLNVSVGVVSLVDVNRQWFKSCIGLDAEETPRDHAFCAYAILDDSPMIVRDACTDERVKDNPLVTGEPHIRFYAGVPLVNSDGFALGTLCVIDFEPREISDDEIEILKSLAKQVVSQIELHRHVVEANGRLQEVEAAYAVAERSAQAKSEFLATMSHEIRTPITAIMGLSEILGNGENVAPFDTNQVAKTIFKNSRYLLEVVNNILEISKVESGKLDIEHINCSIFEIMQDVEAVVNLKALEKDISFLIDYSYPLPNLLQSDPTRLKQVLINFCNNAIKFTDKGSVRVRVSVENATLGVEIVDTGIGMSSDEIERLFNAFQQANPSIARKYGGTGLGLAISKEIVETMGGQIEVESESGIGSRFSFQIPIGVPDEATEVLSNPLLQQLEEKQDTLHLRGKVLLVEDEKVNQRVVTYLLKKVGLEVEIADDGEIALEKALSGNFNLILMDVHLPKLDGLSVTKQLLKEIKTPIVALTASQDPLELEQCFQAGCVEYVPKPFEKNELYSCLRRYMSRDVGELPEAVQDALSQTEFAGSQEYANIVFAYLKKLPVRFSVLEKLFAEKDWDGLRDRAHRLAGAGLFGFPGIALTAKLLEEQATREQEEACLELLKRLGREIGEVSSSKSSSADSYGGQEHRAA